MHINELLRRAAGLFGDRPALLWEGAWETYGAFAGRVSRLARGLRDSGVSPGSRVAVLLPNGRPFLDLYFAAPLAGAVLVPMNVRLSPGETAAVLDDAEPELFIAGTRYAGTALAAREAAPRAPRIVWVPEPEFPQLPGEGTAWDERLLSDREGLPLEGSVEEREDDTAQLYYTSGTTGRPKGVILTHRNVCFHALMAVAELGLDDGDTWLHAAPMFHLADAWACFALTWVGGKHVMAPVFEAGAVLDALQEGEITCTNLIPTMLNALVNHPGAGAREYPSLRKILSGGAPISPELVRRIMDVFRCDYIQTYGLTETSPYLTLSKLKAHLRSIPEEDRFRYKASTGRPLVGVELRVVDEDGSQVPADGEAVGEIVVRGPSVTPGYWKRPEETARAFREGWFHTSDLAVVDDEGYLNIVDRLKDVIVTGGELVYSIEVEHVLQDHPDVLESAVIAVPDERWGEAVKAVVVLREGREPSAESLIASCRERLARYKAPKSVDFAGALPRTGSGKIDKKRLREPFWRGRDRRVN